MSDDNKPDVVYIKGKLMYPAFFVANTKFEPQYTADLLLDAEGKKVAEAANLNIKMKEDWGTLFEGYDGSFIRSSRKVADKTRGVDRTPPEVTDKDKRVISSDTSIGNGTDAELRIIVLKGFAGKTLTPAEAKKKWGGYPSFLMAARINNLVPYERKDASGWSNEEDSYAKGTVKNTNKADDKPFDED